MISELRSSPYFSLVADPSLRSKEFLARLSCAFAGHKPHGKKKQASASNLFFAATTALVLQREHQAMGADTLPDNLPLEATTKVRHTGGRQATLLDWHYDVYTGAWLGKGELNLPWIIARLAEVFFPLFPVLPRSDLVLIQSAGLWSLCCPDAYAASLPFCETLCSGWPFHLSWGPFRLLLSSFNDQSYCYQTLTPLCVTPSLFFR